MGKSIREIAEARGIELPDCGDNSCVFGPGRGMRTNGGCRCDVREDGYSTGTRQLRWGVASLTRLVKILVEAAEERDSNSTRYERYED